MEITTTTTPMPASIEQALHNLLPTTPTNLSDQDLEYLAGVTDEDLMTCAFPDDEQVVAHERFLSTDGAGNDKWGKPCAWSKRSHRTLFLLARRSIDSQETILLKLPLDRSKTTEDIRDALDSGAAVRLLRLLRESPPACLLGYFPSVDQGLVALDRSHADSQAVEKTLEALALHCQIARSALETVSGLAQRLLHLQPAAGALKLAAATHPENLINATREARHALEQMPTPAIGSRDDAT